MQEIVPLEQNAPIGFDPSIIVEGIESTCGPWREEFTLLITKSRDEGKHWLRGFGGSMLGYEREQLSWPGNFCVGNLVVWEREYAYVTSFIRGLLPEDDVPIRLSNGMMLAVDCGELSMWQLPASRQVH